MSDLNGILLVDKPQGWTSHDLVGRIRKLTKQSSVGHCGTLDPLATGLMVILMGEATKLSNYILEGDKRYRLQARLGLTTDTLDSTGQVVSQGSWTASAKQAWEAAQSLTGELDLPVPLFSAVKVAGKALHSYARSGEQVQPPRKIMNFWGLGLPEPLAAEQSGLLAPEHWQMEITCSKGGYIRAWVNRWGELLGCGAVLTGLVRVVSDPYQLEDALRIEQLEELTPEGWRQRLIPLAHALPKYRSVRAQGASLSLLRNGQISHDLRAQMIASFRPGEDLGIKVLSREGNLLALVGVEPEKGFTLRRVFRYEESSL